MPKNTKGGKKTKSLKNSDVVYKNREIPVPQLDDDSHVAIITKVQGDGRYLCQIVTKDGIHPNVYPVNLSKGVKNKYAKNIIIGISTHILISIREFQKDKGDIIFVYKDSELGYLIECEYISIIKKDINNNEIVIDDKEELFDFEAI